MTDDIMTRVWDAYWSDDDARCGTQAALERVVGIVREEQSARIAALEAEFDQMVMECFEVVSTTDVDQNGNHIERRVPKHHLLAARIAALEAENADLRSGLFRVIEENERMSSALASFERDNADLRSGWEALRAAMATLEASK